MGINEEKPIYNLDIIELGGNISDMFNQNDHTNNSEQFKQSVIKNIVWRAGSLDLNPNAGGLWFAETKDDVEKFAISTRNEKRQGNPYFINLKNPYVYDNGFWNGYVIDTENLGLLDGRKTLMMKLLGMGHDGIIINDDTWNDTGDEFAVKGKQYVVFNRENVIPATDGHLNGL